MSIWASFRTRLSTWIDDVAAGLMLLETMLRRSPKSNSLNRRTARFFVVDVGKRGAERADGLSLHIDESGIADPISPQTRLLLARSSVDVALAPSRFIFRSLELPQGARQFLDGVVRSQIDRLTPWSANEAAFGWSEPTEAGNGQIAITVAATARSLVAPIARAAMAAQGRPSPHVDADRRRRDARDPGLRPGYWRRKRRTGITEGSLSPAWLCAALPSRSALAPGSSPAAAVTPG